MNLGKNYVHNNHEMIFIIILIDQNQDDIRATTGGKAAKAWSLARF